MKHVIADDDAICSFPKGADVPQRSETPFDESVENQAKHNETDASPSCTPIQEEEPQITFRYVM